MQAKCVIGSCHQRTIAAFTPSRVTGCLSSPAPFFRILTRGPHRLHASNDDEIPPMLGDWREFRAKLISQTDKVEWRPRVPEENLKLLQVQNPRLAEEELWAHPTAGLEKGGLIVASPDAHIILQDENFWQVVILLVEHGSEGSMGFILNRPTRFTMGKGSSGVPLPIASSGKGLEVQDVFADSRVYCGGIHAQQVVHLLHGQKQLEGCVEVVPGIYTGGEVAACREVTEGACTTQDFRIFIGATLWRPGQLEKQMEAGVWYPAACSRAVALKQCLQLPVPFWREVMELMGGKYMEVAQEIYRNGSDGLD